MTDAGKPPEQLSLNITENTEDLKPALVFCP